jgi:hypothetical protein
MAKLSSSYLTTEKVDPRTRLKSKLLDKDLVSSISLFDGLPITAIDGLPTSASRLV